MPNERSREVEPFDPDRTRALVDELRNPTNPTAPIDSPYPGFVQVGEWWHDTIRDVWYDRNFQKLGYNPTVNRYPEDDPRDPNDDPVNQEENPGDGFKPRVTVKVTGGSGTPTDPFQGQTQTQYPGMSGPAPTNYLGSATPWSGSQGYQLANPMPSRPSVGTMANPGSQSWSRPAGGVPVGDPLDFAPWGEVMAQMSQSLRYGGSPTRSTSGGSAGTVATPGAALPPIVRGSVPGWSSPPNTPPGGSVPRTPISGGSGGTAGGTPQQGPIDPRDIQNGTPPEEPIGPYQARKPHRNDSSDPSTWTRMDPNDPSTYQHMSAWARILAGLPAA